MRSLVLLALTAPVVASAQDSCGPDTLRYGEHRETGTFGVFNAPGEAMGQVYEAPGPVTVSGVEAVMYIDGATTCDPGQGNCVDGVGSFPVRASLYELDGSGLPDGPALVSADSTLSCVCSVGDPNDVRYLIPLPPTIVSSDYAVAVEYTGIDGVLDIVVNDFRTNDGAGENLGLYYFDVYDDDDIFEWVTAGEVSIRRGTTYPADADVYVHPQVTYDLDGSFTPISSDGDTCPNDGTVIDIDAPVPFAEHRMYNELVRSGSADDASTFAFGDGATDTGFEVSHTYSESNGFTISRELQQVGWTRECIVNTSFSYDDEVFHHFDCDGDGFTGDDGAFFCGEPSAQPGQCGTSPAQGFSLAPDDDCNDVDATVFPGADEECDGIDNDCSGVADDGIDPLPDDPVFGECADNVLICDGGVFVESPDNIEPTVEACDNQDDDCNGLIDDGLGLFPAPNTEGACASNTVFCEAGDFLPSQGNVEPSADVCDGIDNDCNPATADGADDPQVGDACDGDDSDDCETGTLSCSGGGLVCSDDADEDDCDPDTDTDPDTEPDTDPDTDPGTDSDTEVDSDSDSDATLPSARCGCSSAPGWGGFAWTPLLALLMWRRRRA